MPWTSTSSPTTNWQAVSPGSVISESLLSLIQAEAAAADASADAAATSAASAAGSAASAASSASAADASADAALDSEVNAQSFATQAQIIASSLTPIPAGGSTGQSLVKNSATDYDYAWATVSGGGGSVNAEDEGSLVVAGASSLNFVGAGVTVTDGGGGEAVVTIPGSSVSDGDKGDIVVSGGGTVWSIDTGAIVNADVNASAAIAYSKLNLTGAILNADLAGSIADSKLSTISTAGKVSNSATTATSANTASAIVARDGSGNFSAGTITASQFSGGGASLTALNASNLGSGTVPDARFPATLPAASGANLTALNASNLGSGTVPDARFPATLPAASGVNLTNLNASNLASGTVNHARLGSGGGGSTKFLREDNTWQTISGGGDALTSNPLSQFAATTSAQLAGVISDETGSGALVFAASPTLTGTVSTAALTASGLVSTAASASGGAGLRLPHGSAPSSPTNGDVWTTTAGIFVRVNGTTIGPLSTGNAATSSGLNQFASTTSAQLAGVISDETGSGALVFGTAPTLANPVFTGERYTKTAPTISSGTLTLDYSAGTVFYVDLNANITTLTINNWPASGTFGRISIRFKADGTARTITWPGAVKWDGGAAPTMASTNTHVTWIHLVTADAGTTIDGLVGAADIG